ncbi:MAG: hypothetical protein U5L96_19795 [Owenweeksia sp.]|nr:hypothetical protein [Owenweeksia sp.]
MVVDSSVTEQQSAETENDEEMGSTAGSNQAEKQWRLVISSMPSRQLAEKFKDQAGEPEAEIRYIDRLDTYRVVYASFTSLEDARVGVSGIL